MAKYGFDYGGPVCEEQINTVEVPVTLECIDEDVHMAYISQVGNLGYSETHTNYYSHAKLLLSDMLSQYEC